MFSYYGQIKSAVNREDFVSVNHRTSAFLASYFDVIFAFNRVLHPGEKKLVEFALSYCQILPENFKNDVEFFCFCELNDKLKTAEKLVKNLHNIL